MNPGITLAITTYNRPEMTVKAFEQVAYDDRINEILIMDDHSEWDNFIKLKELVSKYTKVSLVRNAKNLGCYHNKRKAVQESYNHWVILLDTDRS